MWQIFSKWLNYPKYFRLGFFIILTASVILNRFILPNDDKFYIFYIVAGVFLGIGYYFQPAWFLILCTAIVVLCRYQLVPEQASNIAVFLIHLITYLIITFISAALMKYVQQVKEDELALIQSLSIALDSRDAYTMHHSENVANYAVEIAKKMGLSKEQCHVLHIGGLLHDIGKIGIPEHILTKPGKLTDDEYEIIKTHPTIGYEIIKHIKEFKKSGVLDIVLYHHERYDGKGYPSGLKGDQIPLLARITAVADTFDAMSSKRVYRQELDLDFILGDMRKNKGTQFDPQIIDHFLSLFKHS